MTALQSQTPATVAESATTENPNVPVLQESLGGSLIDAARISVMAALAILPPQPKIVRIGEEEVPSVHECLEMAMEMLLAARVQTIENRGTTPTSLHVVQR